MYQSRAARELLAIAQSVLEFGAMPLERNNYKTNKGTVVCTINIQCWKIDGFHNSKHLNSHLQNNIIHISIIRHICWVIDKLRWGGRIHWWPQCTCSICIKGWLHLNHDVLHFFTRHNRKLQCLVGIHSKPSVEEGKHKKHEIQNHIEIWIKLHKMINTGIRGILQQFLTYS